MARLHPVGVEIDPNPAAVHNAATRKFPAVVADPKLRLTAVDTPDVTPGACTNVGGPTVRPASA